MAFFDAISIGEIFFSFHEENKNFSGAFSAGTTHTLDHADRRESGVVADDKVDFADVEAFFADAGGDKGVEGVVFEELDGFDLFLLVEAFKGGLVFAPGGGLADEDGGADEGFFFEEVIDFVRGGTVVSEDHDAGFVLDVGFVGEEVRQDFDELLEFGMVFAIFFYIRNTFF